MDVLTFLRVVARRWLVVLPVLGLTAGSAYVLGMRVPPTYTANGSLVVVQTSAERVSPEVVGELLTNGAQRAAVAAEGGDPDYEVNVDSTAGILRIIARGKDAQTAIATFPAVVDQLRQVYDEQREAAELPESAGASLDVLSQPVTATKVPGSQFEAYGSVRFTPRDERPPTTLSLDALRAVVTQVTRSLVLTKGFDSEVTITPLRDTPVLNIEATGDDRDETIGAVAAVIDTVPEAVAQVEELLDARTFLVGKPVVVPSDASVSNRGAVRAMLAVVAVGIGLAVAAAITVEAIAEARARRRSERALRERGSEPRGAAARRPRSPAAR